MVELIRPKGGENTGGSIVLSGTVSLTIEAAGTTVSSTLLTSSTGWS